MRGPASTWLRGSTTPAPPGGRVAAGRLPLTGRRDVGHPWSMRRILLGVLVIAAAALLLIQLVPYGRDHTNPPVKAEPAWNAPATRELAVRACFDCHSNETVWPWYSIVAPISWRLQNHVDEGRTKLNFSTWGTGEQETERLADLVREGEMPPWDYLLTHPEARLSDAESQALIDGMAATIGSRGGTDSGGDGEATENGGDDD